MSAFCLLPFFIAFSAFAREQMNPIIYCILIYQNPLYLLIYYPIFRYIFKVSSGMTLISLEWVLMTQYLVKLIFCLFLSIYAGEWGAKLNLGGVIYPDIVAIVSVAVFAFLTLPVLTHVVKRTDFFLEVPSDYAEKKVARKLLSVLVSASSTYIMLVCLEILILRQSGRSIGRYVPVIYLMLIMLQTFRVYDQYQKNRRVIIEWNARATNLYLTSLQQAASKFQQVKHDFYNILQTYEGYLETGNIEKLRAYHHSLYEMTTSAGNDLEVLAALKDRLPVHTLFSVKARDAQAQGVKLDVKWLDALANVAMNDLDLCRILGNLLDNAIEAAVDSEDKKILVRSEFRPRDMAAVVISNTTKGPVDINQIFIEGFTTKDSHTGQGLISVKGIIDTHSRCELSATYADHIFTVNLLFESK